MANAVDLKSTVYDLWVRLPPGLPTLCPYSPNGRGTSFKNWQVSVRIGLGVPDIKWPCIPTGRGNGLRNRLVSVRIALGPPLFIGVLCD